MSLPDYKIKTMTRRELTVAIDWAAQEGWNPGRYDADCFYAADPNGFLMGWLDSEPIAAISVVKYSETFGFLGFYTVRPAYRGQGYGLQIWQAGLRYLKGCNIGLDGVVAQQDNYVKSGFRLAHRNIRYEGIGGRLQGVERAERVVAIARSQSLSNEASIPLSAVIDYDRAFFPAPRVAFLKRWLAQPESCAVGIMHHQQLAGYGVLRTCYNGYKIGPLFADTAQFADDIFLALQAQVAPGAPFYLDVPEINSQAIELTKRYQLNSVFETARMYTQQSPNLPWDRTFGVTTFELG